MPANESLRLAIVDDDEGARTAVARLLRCLGHDVRPFESAEAIEAVDVAELALDCLIVDVRLPGVSGPELRDRLRTKGMATPVVFITGDANVKARDAARTGGALTVVKPFDGDTLLAAVDAAISAAPGSSVPYVR
jgi:FixJ family two-component response regulator